MNALFVKNGVPVNFCFHSSVTQGRGRITRDVERHGGRIVANEREANVLLVDEQENIRLIRRRYYSSTEIYRHSIFVEPRGFVQACLRAGRYWHEKPTRQGMPGRRPGEAALRPRVAFTEEDRNHLAFYLATVLPTRDGRFGLAVYKDLEQMGRTDDASWAWVRRHTFHSWREQYVKHPAMMDQRIAGYVQRLKTVGHHFGHDARSHDYRQRLDLREEEDEDEDEDEDDEDERSEEMVREEEQFPLAPAPRRPDQAARQYLARHQRDLLTFDEEEERKGEEGEEDDEIVYVEPQHATRNRAHPDAHRRHESRETQAGKGRVSEGLSDESRGESREEDAAMEHSSAFEGSDLFGSGLHDQGFEFPVPFSPRANPVREQEGPLPSTQATLIASPLLAEKEMEAPPSTQRALPRSLVMIEERVRGSSADPGPSITRERTRTEGDVGNTRASLQDSANGKRKEVVLMEKETSVEEEESVEGLLKASTRIEEDEYLMTVVPQSPEIEIAREPSDSDDAATHASLLRDVAHESESEEEQDDADRIERMASGKLYAVRVAAPPKPKVTRSKTASQQFSPRRTRSGRLPGPSGKRAR